jgi:hypothetical protein
MIKWETHPSRCLDTGGSTANGQKPHLWDCDANNANQKWMIEGNLIKWKTHPSRCLDTSGSTANGQQPHLWDCDANNANQKWTVPGDITSDLELDLVGSDYSAGGSTWSSRVGSLEATVPAGVGWDAAERAFSFSAGGSTITVDLATNPNAMDQVSYEAWFKLPSSPSNNNGWILTQNPDYGWSRAVTVNDKRLGYTSITPGTWDSGLGTPSLNEWHHVVGVWDQGGTSTIYLDGVKGEDKASTSNGAGSNNAETFNIGGIQTHDANGMRRNNPTVYISDVRVYSRAISASDVAALFERGRRSVGASSLASNMHILIAPCFSKNSCPVQYM